MKFTPWKYQQYTTDRMVEDTCGPLLEMGLGKTVSALTAVDQMLKSKTIKKPLVIAPLRVAEVVWTGERDKWDHLNHLKISKIIGTEANRKRALLEKADLYVINRENIPWLVAFYGKGFPFDCVIIDESSSFKDPKSKRFRALRQVAPLIKRKYILTGTPIPNGLLDMWSQVYFLDRGKRLGESFSNYRKEYFQPDKRNRQTIFSYALKTDDMDILGKDFLEKEIHQKIGDICFSMKARDYLNMPPRIDTTTMIPLSAEARAKYDEFERDQVLKILEAEITALSAGVLYNKLLQFANGAVYDENKIYHEIHMAKIDALEERIEAANGHPVLVLYQFKHDVERIMKHLKRFKPVFFEKANQVEAWNRKEIPVFVGHPASMGHGLNMQDGGHLIEWFGRPWSSEMWSQAIARLDRQGQKFSVINNTLACIGTVDERVIERSDGKLMKQEYMMQAVKAIIEKWK